MITVTKTFEYLASAKSNLKQNNGWNSWTNLIVSKMGLQLLHRPSPFSFFNSIFPFSSLFFFTISPFLQSSTISLLSLLPSSVINLSSSFNLPVSLPFRISFPNITSRWTSSNNYKMKDRNNSMIYKMSIKWFHIRVEIILFCISHQFTAAGTSLIKKEGLNHDIKAIQWKFAGANCVLANASRYNKSFSDMIIFVHITNSFVWM